jgi:hypothetical protein
VRHTGPNPRLNGLTTVCCLVNWRLPRKEGLSQQLVFLSTKGHTTLKGQRTVTEWQREWLTLIDLEAGAHNLLESGKHSSLSQQWETQIDERYKLWCCLTITHRMCTRVIYMPYICFTANVFYRLTVWMHLMWWDSLNVPLEYTHVCQYQNTCHLVIHSEGFIQPSVIREYIPLACTVIVLYCNTPLPPLPRIAIPSIYPSHKKTWTHQDGLTDLWHLSCLLGRWYQPLVCCMQNKVKLVSVLLRMYLLCHCFILLVFFFFFFFCC